MTIRVDETRPIVRFSNREEGMVCLREWQNLLFLNDWIIDLNLEDNWCEHDQNLASNDYQPTLKTSIITMDTKDHYGMMKQPHELVLVHELLHLKFLFSENAPETTEGGFFGMVEHMVIEEMARSLIMAKYDLTPEWFRNERVDAA